MFGMFFRYCAFALMITAVGMSFVTSYAVLTRPVVVNAPTADTPFIYIAAKYKDI